MPSFDRVSVLSTGGVNNPPTFAKVANSVDGAGAMDLNEMGANFICSTCDTVLDDKHDSDGERLGSVNSEE